MALRDYSLYVVTMGPIAIVLRTDEPEYDPWTKPNLLHLGAHALKNLETPASSTQTRFILWGHGRVNKRA